MIKLPIFARVQYTPFLSRFGTSCQNRRNPRQGIETEPFWKVLYRRSSGQNRRNPRQGIETPPLGIGAVRIVP